MKGVLDGAGFPAVVTAHFVPAEGQQRPRTTILIKFAEEVVTTISIKSNFARLIFTFSLNNALEDAIYGKFLQKFITQWNLVIRRGFSMLSILRDGIDTFLLTFPILSSLLDDIMILNYTFV